MQEIPKISATVSKISIAGTPLQDGDSDTCAPRFARNSKNPHFRGRAQCDTRGDEAHSTAETSVGHQQRQDEGNVSR